MTNVVARIKQQGKTFEILVDVDKALEYKKGINNDIRGTLAIDGIFYDSKKGTHASEKDLKGAFGSDDIYSIADKIIKQGEIQVPLEYKQRERGEKEKQIIDFIVRNAVDPRTDRPYTPDRIERSLDEAGVNITNKPVESQINEVVSKLKLIIPIKIQTKKIRLIIPSQYTGNAYGLITHYKESEEWMGNGDLKCIVNIPVGFQMEFYDKLNSMTHGSVMSEEIKE